MKLFLDANVLFTAAHNDNGISRGLFRLAARDMCEIVSSAYAVDEAQRNLARKCAPACACLDSLVTGIRVVREPAPSLAAAMV